MGYGVLVSATFQRFFNRLDDKTQGRIRDGLNELSEDPYRPRPGADIKKLENTQPTKQRVRVGSWRIIYHIDDDVSTVKVIEGFDRGRGYR